MAGHAKHLGADRWRLYVDGPRDPMRPRKRNQITRVVRASSERDADRQLARLVGDVDAGRPLKPMTFAELVAKWLPEHHVTESVRAEYQGNLDRYLLPAIGDRAITAVKPGDLDDIYTAMRRKGRAAATIRKVHTVARAAFGQALKWELVDRSPAELASPPPVPSSRPKAPAGDVVARLLAHADAQLLAFITLKATTGARRGELAALRRTDLDLDAGVINIARAFAYAPRVGMYEKLTKEEDVRQLALDPATVAVLRVHLAKQAERDLEFGVADVADSFVFHKIGRPLEALHVEEHTRRFAELRTKLKLTGADVQLRQLRHFVGTELIHAGYDAVDVAAHLGHRSPNTTLRFYAAPRAERDRPLADEMRRRIGRGSSSA